MKVLGFNIGSHDTAAALIDTNTGCLLGAIEQERLNRKKHTKDLPAEAAFKLLHKYSLKSQDIAATGFGWNFELMFKSLYLSPLPESKKDIDAYYAKRDFRKFINLSSSSRKLLDILNLDNKPLNFCHHLSHHAHSYFSSGFEKATSICIDGYGDCSTITIAKCSQGSIKIIKSIPFPESIGLWYSGMTYYLGFKPHCDEGITMGLAPFGDPHESFNTSQTYLQFVESLISFDNGSVSVNSSLLHIGHQKLGWTTSEFDTLAGSKRDSKTKITDRYKNLAAAVQLHLENLLIRVVEHSFELTKYRKNLCLSGGVALNCVANYKISKHFGSKVYVPQSPGDSGVAIGSAILAARKINPEVDFDIASFNKTSYGPSYENEIKELSRNVASCSNYKIYNLNKKDFINKVAHSLYEGKIVGWFYQGSEFGPRALGHRSILAKPNPIQMRDFVNKRVKFREEFRPFAPAILSNHCTDYFDLDFESRHMLFAADYKDYSPHDISATVHVDNTARVQQVDERNGLFFDLLEHFYQISGIPVLLNTSFNVKGQPIVETPQEAFDTFVGTNIDVLALEIILFEK